MRLNQSLVAANPFEKHLINRRRKKKARGRSSEFALMLTSLVDMFSILVIFLLQTFSSSPEIALLKGLDLPRSITLSTTKSAPVLAMSKDGNIYLDQKLMGKIAEVTANPRALLVKLEDIKKGWARSHTTPFAGEINLQAHKDIESTTVSSVMNLLTGSHFSSIQLAVVGK